MKKNTNKGKKHAKKMQKKYMKQRKEDNKPSRSRWPTGANNRTTFKD